MEAVVPQRRPICKRARASSASFFVPRMVLDGWLLLPVRGSVMLILTRNRPSSGPFT